MTLNQLWFRLVCLNEKEGGHKIHARGAHKTPASWEVMFFVIFGGGLWNGEEHHF
jgi:hypothetical protein